MKRGTSAERGLAYAGIALWAGWGLLSLAPPTSPIAVGVSAAGVFLGLREIKQWQGGELMTRPARKAGTPVYPRWGWFAVGAVPAAFIVAIASVLTSSAPVADDELFVPGAIAWVAGGLAMQTLLVARANRRKDAAAPLAVPVVPPPPRPDPA
jgi:hypothetical protein